MNEYSDLGAMEEGQICFQSKGHFSEITPTYLDDLIVDTDFFHLNNGVNLTHNQ